MASLQDIKRRIKSVTNTRQITKAMQLVAASKLRRYAQAATLPKAYVDAANTLLANLGASAEVAQNPLYQTRKVNNALTILVAGDRTLAGPYNSNIFRAFNGHLKTLGVPQKVISVGRRAGHQIIGVRNIDEIASYSIEGGVGDVELAQPILKQIIDKFTAGDVDVVHIIYTQYNSTVSQEIKIKQVLPVVSPTSAGVSSELEPSPEAVIDLVTKKLLESQILLAFLESRASEQAARMIAMMNASDNADDLIKDYTLDYNNARQQAITQELAEISAGTEAMNA